MNNNIYHEVLENGLNVYLYKDSSKHTMYAKYVIRYGGNNVDFEYEGKHYNTNAGIAHFLEHTLIENSSKGNMFKLLGEKQMRANGGTTREHTEFYFDCVKNFSYGLRSLINMVDNPVFKESQIDAVKKVILEEERQDFSNKFRKLYNAIGNNIVKNVKYVPVIGTKESISSITYDELMLCYRAFYHPTNKILVIGGNIDIDKTMTLVKKLCNKKVENNSLKIDKVEEPRNVNKEYEKIITPTGNKYVCIGFKINMSNLNIDKMIFDYYMGWYKVLNFKKISDLHKKLISKKIIIDYMDFNCTSMDDYIVITIGSYTDKEKEFIEEVKNGMKNKFKKEDFELFKKGDISYAIRIPEKLGACVNTLCYNVIQYDYEGIVDSSILDKLNVEELNNIIDNLDYSNYTVGVLSNE